MSRKAGLSQIGAMPFTTRDLKRLGLLPNDLRRLLRNGEVLRIGRGVYQVTSSDLDEENQFRGATKRIRGPSAVCLLSALSFYNLTDEIPRKVWLMVEATRRSYQRDIRLFRSRDPRWKVGIDDADGYRITNVERTIVECLVHQKKLGDLGIEALKRAVKDKKTQLGRVMDMAKKLDVAHRVLPYIQALS